MGAATGSDGAGTSAIVVAALSDPATYPDGPDTVTVHETHGSWVFVAGPRAYKVKKPVVLAFLDYGTLERRRAMCREELRLNRRLAPELYLGTVALVRRGDGFALDDDDATPDALEVAVAMARFDEADTLASRIGAGCASAADARAVGVRLAAFHAATPAHADPTAVATLRTAIRGTLDDLEADGADPHAIAALRSLMEAFLSARRKELDARARAGRVRDGHGDLRAEHVLLTDPLQVVDAIEFDPGLRVIDVAADLAFLAMDLEGLGAADLAGELVDAYRGAGGDPGDDALLAAMACYRALVRAKVDLVRSGQGAAAARERAGQRIALARRFAWRARGPLVLAVCGPPASGKSTLAAAIAADSGRRALSSDLVRKELVGIAPTERAGAGAYDAATTRATYRELGRRAAQTLATAGGVIVDATLGDHAMRDALREGLGSAGAPLVFVECRAPAALLDRRAGERERNPGRVSDAGPEIARDLRARWQPLDEVPANDHVALRTDRPVGDALVTLWRELDLRLASGPRR